MTPPFEWEPWILKDYDFTGFAPGQVVIGIGCGRGEQLKELMRGGCKAVGLEADWSFVIACKRRGLPVMSAEAEALPIRSGSLDGVICKVVLPYVDEARVLGEIARTLKPGGLARCCYHGAGYYLRTAYRVDSERPYG